MISILKSSSTLTVLKELKIQIILDSLSIQIPYLGGGI
jgi:hypothetical protein